MTEILILAGAVAFCLICAAACLRWEAIAIPVLISAVVEVHLGLDLGWQLDFTSIYPIDLIVLAAALAATIRQITGVERGAASLIWLLTLACWALALARGMSAYGPVDALIGFRKFLYVAVLGLYVLSFPINSRDILRFFVMWALAAVLLSLYATLVMIDSSFSLRIEEQFISNYIFANERALPAVGALFIAQAALVGLSLSLRDQHLPWRILAVALLPLVVVLYHRTVWVAVLAGIFVLLIADPRRGMRMLPMLMLIGIVSIFSLLLMSSFGLDVVARSLRDAVLEPLDYSASSIGWRVEGWQVLVSRAFGEGPLRILFGAGFGVDYVRRIGWSTVAYSPHNLYVEIFLTAGLLGLMPFLWFFSHTLYRAFIDTDYTLRTTRIVLLSSLMIFGLSYNFNYEQGLLLGMLGALWQRQSRAETAMQPHRAGI